MILGILYLGVYETVSCKGIAVILPCIAVMSANVGLLGDPLIFSTDISREPQ